MNNIEVAKYFQIDLWDKKDITAIEKYFAKDAKIHSPLKGETKRLSEMREIIATWLQAFPDLTVDWEEIIVDGNTVASRWSATGTHASNFLNIPASNKKITYSGATFYKVDNAKITEYWAFVNIDEIKKQL